MKRPVRGSSEPTLRWGQGAPVPMAEGSCTMRSSVCVLFGRLTGIRSAAGPGSTAIPCRTAAVGREGVGSARITPRDPVDDFPMGLLSADADAAAAAASAIDAAIVAVDRSDVRTPTVASISPTQRYRYRIGCLLRNREQMTFRIIGRAQFQGRRRRRPTARGCRFAERRSRGRVR